MRPSDKDCEAINRLKFDPLPLNDIVGLHILKVPYFLYTRRRNQSKLKLSPKYCIDGVVIAAL